MAAVREKSKSKQKPSENEAPAYPEPSEETKDNTVYPDPAKYAKYHAFETFHIRKPPKVEGERSSEEKGEEEE